MRATPFSHEELALVILGGADRFDNDISDLAIALAEEVLHQREWLAYIARVIEAQTFDMARLAKCRRDALERTVLNIEGIVLGKNIETPVGMAREYRRLINENSSDARPA